MDSKKRALSLMAKVASAAALAAAIALVPTTGQACDNPGCKGGEACAKAHDGKEGCACPGECKMGDKCDGKNCPCAAEKKAEKKGEGSCGASCGCSGAKDAHEDQGKHEGHDKQDNHGKKDDHGKKEPAVENDASPSRGAGLRAVLDPATGEFVAPAGGDASAEAAPSSLGRASAPVEVAMADGGVMAPFPADRAGAVVATVADGRSQASCTH